MNFRQTIAILLFAFFAGMIAGYLFRGNPDPEIIERTKRSYLPLPQLPEIQKPTLDFTRQYRFIHTEKVDTVEVPVPVSYNDRFYVTQTRPISIQGRTVQFRYYDPLAREEGIDEFTIRRQSFQHGLYADVFWPVDHLLMTDFRPMVGVRYSMDLWRFQAHVGTYYSVYDKDFAAMGGLSFKIFGN